MGVAQLVLGLQSWSQEPRFESWQRQCRNINLSNFTGLLSHHDLHPPPGRRAVCSWRASEILQLVHSDICGPTNPISKAKRGICLTLLMTIVENMGLFFSGKIRSLYSWGTYHVWPGTNLSFDMIWCTRRSIGPHPPRSMPLFKWIHTPEFETSTPSEEALVRGNSHIQCNPLTLLNTRS
ncbi:hypothetical protein M9H77_32166 [Catharanthus roseus]|uniref:Uncharacterized protein n=1 Tax=Catharanthus roseus TaxID=4058 RepID=A0ACC0A308_CATRO|nr:hypothetical protein M9H77_32166 [Catharanthus roseus]